MKKYIKIALLFVSIIVSSCRNNKYTIYTKYYKAIRNNEIIHYEKRTYNNVLDSINESVIAVDYNGNFLWKENHHFIKTKKGLDIIINGQRQVYLDLTKNDTCVIYKHPMGFNVRNCFDSYINYKENNNVIKFVRKDEVTDGSSLYIYLANDFSLIDKKDLGFAIFDEIVNINKRVIPRKIISELNDY